MNYKITQADLIGDIADFPIEVVKKMIERQVEQGNKADVKVFQFEPDAGGTSGGFCWERTIEGIKFWRQVIGEKNFELFFEKYPQRHYVYIAQDGTKNGSDIIETLERRGGVNSTHLSGSGLNCYYYIHPTTKLIISVLHDKDIVHWIKTFYTEIDVEPSIKEYTMQEIADKLGIDVSNLRIKR